mgnify:CR=1 FL=1
MKKTLISLAVLSTLSASAIASVNVYQDETMSLNIGGRAHTQVDVFDGKTVADNYARLNFSGESALNEDVKGFFFLEKQFNFNDSDAQDTNRDMYVGIDTNYGAVKAGFFDSALNQITDFTDIQMIGGAKASQKLDGDREDNSIGYSIDKYDFSFDAKVKLEDYDYEERHDAGNKSVSTSVVYSGIKHVTFGAGYAFDDLHKQYQLASGATFGDLYLGALYSIIDVELSKGTWTNTGYELAAAYTFDKLKFTYSYNNLDVEQVPLFGNNPPKENPNKENHTFDVTYSMTKNFKVFAGVDIDQIREINHFIGGGRFDF